MMKLKNRRSWIVVPVGVLAFSLLTGCLDQFNPRPDWHKFEQERTNASAPHPDLKENGEMPFAFGQEDQAVAAAAQKPEDIYSTVCASCHGAKGMGDGVAGAALNPKPRNLTDKAWQASSDDARIYKVIAEGGASVGLSAYMGAYGGAYSKEEITSLVKFIRKMVAN